MEPKTFGSFDINAIAASFPDHAKTMLIDHYLTDEPEASTRVFRVYQETPPHYHEYSDEFLYVVSGRGVFWMDKPENAAEFGPGTFVFFKKRTVHAMPQIVEGPVIFLSLDAPRRRPADIIFVNPEDGTPESFISKRESL